MKHCKYCKVPMKKTKDGYLQCPLCGYALPSRKMRIDKAGLFLVSVAVLIIVGTVFGALEVERINSEPYEDVGTYNIGDTGITASVKFKSGVSESIYFVFYAFDFFAVGLIILGSILLYNEYTSWR